MVTSGAPVIVVARIGPHGAKRNQGPNREAEEK